MSDAADALDHAELIARVPALQASAAVRVKGYMPDWQCYDLDFEDRAEGLRRMTQRPQSLPFRYPPIMPIFQLPNHPLVRAYAAELAAIIPHAEPETKNARRIFKAARRKYEWRTQMRGDRQWSDRKAGEKFVSLRAILEARAEAMFWFEIVKRLDLERERERLAEWRRRKAAFGPEYVTIDGVQVRRTLTREARRHE